MSSQDTLNPYGGVSMGRIVESFDPNERLKGHNVFKIKKIERCLQYFSLEVESFDTFMMSHPIVVIVIFRS